ncbi:dTDP-4-amino-4,6-dideoxygalactose transaminase [Nonlabens mediterrranea]|uniref:dTDP-4-amino-4,6-dideoxygalactose transaminase n=1 Tax=Nonlabens mediterrranea TaxID=1419947 RepID=A0ABS0A2N2_9FLAO|nr:dTDP-4-amino-4,6-dideoxygalactose transaminase [Nonlabens mediterrranea]
MIPFNKPYLSGKETIYISQAVASGKISGNGDFTMKCQYFFESKYHFKKCLLTTSCTDALEMAAILISISEGDEVIVPSYTFVSSALAFVREGARIVFADSEKNNPNIDVSKLETLITHKTKAIVVVHYAGVACDMDAVMELSRKHNLYIIEDAAQAIDSYYKNRPLGSIGHLSTFSFHETKNIISGEGGMLAINDERLIPRSEIIWEKGTNRASFFRGEINKYGWVDTGSSFLPSEVTAAFLYAQLECLDAIQAKRKAIWNTYNKGLQLLKTKGVGLPFIPDYATNNAHMFYLVLRSEEERSVLIKYLKKVKVQAVFHYLSLHKSDYYLKKNQSELPQSDLYTKHLLRLPFYYELSKEDQESIIVHILNFFNNE